MKVTARDIAALVRDTQVEMMRKRSTAPKESIIDALIQDEMAKMTSLLEGESAQSRPGTEGAESLDPASFVNPSSWASEVGGDTFGARRPPNSRPARRQGATPTPAPPIGGTGPSDIAVGLEHQLEPERTGVHASGRPGLSMGVIVLVVLVLAAAAATAVFVLMKG
ncbi:MAG: hypothetical protein IPI49_29170 [Myxococcales bacterium]|nr:hypothetical protein [Myxococcales bacterium]